MSEGLRLTKREIEFYQPLVASYLKHGSVDKVFGECRQNTGVSYPHFHRILNDWGIIKSAGPQSHFAEAIFFLTALAKEKLPLETVYKMMPPRLQISAVTLHRILSYIKKGLTRRHATALITSPPGDENSALIGRDISNPRPEIGKPYGSYSLPMTYSKDDESDSDSILRVLQQEVASTLAVSRQLPITLIPQKPTVLFTIDIADVRVKVFQLTLPEKMLSHLDSYKLEHLTFIPLNQIATQTDLQSHFRAGVAEIAQGCLEIRATSPVNPPHYWSLLNKKLALLPLYA